MKKQTLCKISCNSIVTITDFWFFQSNNKTPQCCNDYNLPKIKPTYIQIICKKFNEFIVSEKQNMFQRNQINEILS